MNIGLDTSVVVRLLIGEPHAQAVAAGEFLEELKRAGRGPALVSDLVLGETYFALRHHYAVPAPEALLVLHAFTNDDRVKATPAAMRVLRAPHEATKPEFMDRLIHAHYQDNGVSMATFDKVAGRLPAARILAV